MSAVPAASSRVATRPPWPVTWLPVAACAVAAASAVDVAWSFLLPLRGGLGFWLVTYLLFLGLVGLTTWLQSDGETARDRLATVVLATAGTLLVAGLLCVVGFTAVRGWAALHHSSFFRETTAFTGPADPLSHGGVYAAIIGTLEQVALATALSVPLALVTAFYLSETRGRGARIVRVVVETMTAIPSIVAGLFVFAVVVLTFGFQRSGFGAALALSVEMLPVVARAAEVVLRLVPAGLKEASYALGASRLETARRVTLPTAGAGLVTAVLLGVARVVGETAPVLLVAGFTNELNYDPFKGAQVSLPLFTLTYVRFPVTNAIDRAFGSATVLIVVVLVLFGAARALAARSNGRRTRVRRRRTLRPGVAPTALVAGAALVISVALPAVSARADSGYVSITGAGSTWSQVAIDAWRADVRGNGLVVNYSGTGSTDGRTEYIQNTVDFAVSEIPFQDPPEPGQSPERPSRPYAYLPIVAGGTSFMYHLTVAGKQVTDLRLSPSSLAGIFTGAITSWNDPAIAVDNPGRGLPDEPVIPVIRSDGAGASAQFTRYMSREAPDVWCPFEEQQLGVSRAQCGQTSFYPAFGNAKSQAGSNGVANYVSASYGEGSIGFVEYAYAKRINYPVAGLLNTAGYYAQPTPGNVAVALTKAHINSDLTQDLDDVYVNPDARTYPMSSYSYFIVPTTTASPFTTDKGRSLSTFINYFLCAGQQKAGVLGYSPLPANLVQAGFDQVARIPGAVDSPSLSSCNNPALQVLQTAPQPDPCTKKGAVCSTAASSTGAQTGPVRTVSTSSGQGTRRTVPSAGKPTKGATGSAAPSAGPGGAAGAVLDPAGEVATGTATAAEQLSLTSGAGTPTGTTGTVVAGQPTVLSDARPLTLGPQAGAADTRALAVVAALTVLLAMVGPPILVRRLRSRRSQP